MYGIGIQSIYKEREREYSSTSSLVHDHTGIMVSLVEFIFSYVIFVLNLIRETCSNSYKEFIQLGFFL